MLILGVVLGNNKTILQMWKDSTANAKDLHTIIIYAIAAEFHVEVTRVFNHLKLCEPLYDVPVTANKRPPEINSDQFSLS